MEAYIKKVRPTTTMVFHEGPVIGGTLCNSSQPVEMAEVTVKLIMNMEQSLHFQASSKFGEIDFNDDLFFASINPKREVMQ